MTDFAVVRNISSEELAEFRRRNGRPRPRRPLVPSRYQGPRHEVESVSGNDAFVSVPARPGVKREARDVRDSLTERRMGAMRRLAEKDRDAYVHLVEHLRAKNPSLMGSMTNEEAIKTIFENAHREATETAFKKLGRGKVVIAGG